MNSAQRLKQEEEDTSRRWKTLQAKLASIRAQYDIETHIDEKLRLKQVIETSEGELLALDAHLDKLTAQIAEERARALVLEARERERKQSYESAIACWKELEALKLPGYDAAGELARLEQLKAQDDRRRDLLRQLVPRFQEIASVFKEVAEFLQQSASGPADAAELLIEQLVRRELAASDFLNLWPTLRASGASRAAPTLDFVLLYNRLARGELALFLGADLGHELDATSPSERHLATELAEELQLVPQATSWPLSAVAEYFQMTSEHGTHALVRGVYGHMKRGTGSNALYALLSSIDAPLLVISASQDTRLESAFQHAGKRYVVVMSVISAVGGFHPGQVLLHYSDRERPETPMLGEQLSHLSLLDEGYSLVFKLRGTCPPPDRSSERALCSLLLSERNYFDFARTIDKILPTYLGAKLGSRGFWFLGFAPDEWEDRLLASAILDARRSAEPANVVRTATSKFETAYWESRGVRRHIFGLTQFVEQLERASK
jgi:hypothetical protein